MYSNLTILSNEDNIVELGFKDREIAEKFVNGASKMWMAFQGNKDKLVMQFIADSMKVAIETHIFEEVDLYKYSEMEIIEGRLYFIKDEFIEKYNPKYKLMENKEAGTKRPTYFCFRDKVDKNILWDLVISYHFCINSIEKMILLI